MSEDTRERRDASAAAPGRNSHGRRSLFELDERVLGAPQAAVQMDLGGRAKIDLALEGRASERFEQIRREVPPGCEDIIRARERAPALDERARVEPVRDRL